VFWRPVVFLLVLLSITFHFLPLELAPAIWSRGFFLPLFFLDVLSLALAFSNVLQFDPYYLCLPRNPRFLLRPGFMSACSLFSLHNQHESFFRRPLNYFPFFISSVSPNFISKRQWTPPQALSFSSPSFIERVSRSVGGAFVYFEVLHFFSLQSRFLRFLCLNPLFVGTALFSSSTP